MLHYMLPIFTVIFAVFFLWRLKTLFPSFSWFSDNNSQRLDQNIRAVTKKWHFLTIFFGRWFKCFNTNYLIHFLEFYKTLFMSRLVPVNNLENAQSTALKQKKSGKTTYFAIIRPWKSSKILNNTLLRERQIFAKRV